MTKPIFTDESKYPAGYVPASKTDIRKTFARIRKQMAEDAKQNKEIEQERRVKVKAIR